VAGRKAAELKPYFEGSGCQIFQGNSLEVLASMAYSEKRAATEPRAAGAGEDHDAPFPSAVTTGWRPGCTCGSNQELVPCTVLDPFHGAGTTAVVALKQGCRYIGIEMNQAYIDMSLRRLRPQIEQQNLFRGECG